MKKAVTVKDVLLCILYWFLQCTWGIIMTFIGALTFFVIAVICKGRVRHNKYGFVVEIGYNWGGLSLGPFAFTGRYTEKNGPCYDVVFFEFVRTHEYGHSIQNIILGPLFPFLIGIPSAIRYHIYMHSEKTWHWYYNLAWFEHWANLLGHRFI